MTSLFHRLLRLAAWLAASLALSTAAAAPVRVSIDTAGLGATEGFLELQLSATVGAGLVLADVTGFTGFDLASVQVGDSWGSTALPGGYRLRNDTPNDVLHAVRFGSVLSFILDLSGVADPSYVTLFTATLWDSSFNPLGDAAPFTNALLRLDWVANSGGNGDFQVAYQGDQVRLSAPGAPAAVPEPNAAWLVVAALAGWGVARRGRHGRWGRSLLTL